MQSRAESGVHVRARPFVSQMLVGAVRHEHPDAAPLDDKPLVNQERDGLVRRRRVDAVSGGVLSGGGEPISVREIPGEDLGADLLCDLEVDRG